MFGPGAYRPDPSEGITLPATLPQPEIVPYSRNDIRQPCPRCGHLEKALTFLDDQLLPSTSHAVERGHRRYRKIPKSVYRVRTQA